MQAHTVMPSDISKGHQSSLLSEVVIVMITTPAGVLHLEQRSIMHLHGSGFGADAPSTTGRQAAWSADGRSFAVAGADGVRLLDFSPGSHSRCAVGEYWLLILLILTNSFEFALVQLHGKVSWQTAMLLGCV